MSFLDDSQLIALTTYIHFPRSRIGSYKGPGNRQNLSHCICSSGDYWHRVVYRVRNESEVGEWVYVYAERRISYADCGHGRAGAVEDSGGGYAKHIVCDKHIAGLEIYSNSLAHRSDSGRGSDLVCLRIDDVNQV